MNYVGLCERSAVLINDLFGNPNPVTGNTDHPLDERLMSINWVPENNQVSPRQARLWKALSQNAVPDKKGILHGACWNHKGLDEDERRCRHN